MYVKRAKTSTYDKDDILCHLTVEHLFSIIRKYFLETKLDLYSVQ